MTGPLQRRRIRRQAGGSAVREYERLKKEWRRRNRKFFVALSVAVAAIALVTWVPNAHHPWSYWPGVVFGMSLAALIVIRESPPAWIEQYLVGSWGEERTAKAIEPLLSQGWVVLHDLGRGKSNIDHVLVGPAGVYMLDSKNLQGEVRIDGDTLSLIRPGGVRPAYTSDVMAKQARRQAVDLNKMLRQRLDSRVWINAVVVVWADFPQQAAAGRDMTYVHGDQLVEWMSGQPARLSANQVAAISAALAPGQRRSGKPAVPAPTS